MTATTELKNEVPAEGETTILTITPAVVGDVPALAGHVAVTHEQGPLGDAIPYDVETITARLLAMVATDQPLLVLRDGEQIVGVAGSIIGSAFVNAASKIASEVVWCVDAEYRQAEVTRRLLEALTAEASKRGAKVILTSARIGSSDEGIQAITDAGFETLSLTFGKGV